MTASAFSATITFGAGVILLLGWLYLTTDNARSFRLLLKSILLFVLPGAALAALPPKLFQFPLGMWLAVLIEECMKAIAARTEKKHSDRFFLIALFGIWELMLVKPLVSFFEPWVVNGLSNFQIVGLMAGGLLAVLMHVVTAEIYAFRLPNRLVIAIALSWLLHTVFDESVDLLGVSMISFVLQLMPLLFLFAFLWPRASASVGGRIH
jgi:hypothetical protein